MFLYIVLADDVEHFDSFMYKYGLYVTSDQFFYVSMYDYLNGTNANRRDYILVRLGVEYNRRIPFEMRAELEQNARHIWNEEDFASHWEWVNSQ